MKKHRENLLEEAAGVHARPFLLATIATTMMSVGDSKISDVIVDVFHHHMRFASAAVLHADPHKLALSAVDRYREIVTENYGVNNQVEG